MIKKLLFVFLTLIPLTSMADAYSSNNYRPNNKTVKLEETNLPIVFINTKQQVIHKDYRIAVRMKIINNADGINYGDTLTHPDQTVDYEGWIGFKKKGIFYQQKERQHGKTKWSYYKLLNLALNGITSFTTTPLRFASIFGIIVSLLAFLYLIYIYLYVQML